MPSTIATVFLALIALYCLKVYLRFHKNLADAKASGIPYTIVPFYQASRLYRISCIFLLPILRLLPVSWTDPWLDLTLDWAWKRRYEPFARMRAQTFLTVSPRRNVLFVAEAPVIAQITNRRTDFPKALEVYDTLRIYGSNVVTTEGLEWRHQRKITSPPFSERNNHLVWRETLDQSQAMVNSWFGDDKQTSKTIRTMADDAMRLSLHIISRAGFGVHLSWPGTAKDQEKAHVDNSSLVGEGHVMSYTDALGSLLHNIIPVIALPRCLLKSLPFKATKQAYLAYIEWGKYMKEMFDKKKSQILAGEEGDTMDLMFAMLKGAGVTAKDRAQEGGKPTEQMMTDEEIMGNAFVFILAGHETTANSVHFCMVYLAMNIPAQRHLQRDLDETFQRRPVSEWDYDRDIPKLFGNMAGAVLNEELRLLMPVMSLPKCTEPGSPQPLTVGGKKCTVPANTYIALMGHSAHRNPNQWPTGPPADPNNPSHPLSNRDNDLEEFKPERWFLNTDAATTKDVAKPAEKGAEEDTSALGINTAPDTSASLFKPEKGAYLPFSEGYRSCLGRRFAQVELLAFLAFVFSQYSVELSVEEWASDEQVEKMDEIGKREVWGKAKAKVERQMLNDMGSIITLQLRTGHIALRLVKRGSEMFDYS
ncbi:MAG: hypothetical protein Q9217_002906 [Psora testacea]